jgi:hypothetical protein
VMSSKIRCRIRKLGVGIIRLAVIYVTFESAVKMKLLRLAGFDKSLYTWGGVHFGRRVKSRLVTRDGVEIGQFYGDEVFGASGVYLGELKDGRLITHSAKTSKRWAGFKPRLHKSCAEQEAQMACATYAGYEEFPHPDTFHQSIKASAA